MTSQSLNLMKFANCSEADTFTAHLQQTKDVFQVCDNVQGHDPVDRDFGVLVEDSQIKTKISNSVTSMFRSFQTNNALNSGYVYYIVYKPACNIIHVIIKYLYQHIYFSLSSKKSACPASSSAAACTATVSSSRWPSYGFEGITGSFRFHK